MLVNAVRHLMETAKEYLQSGRIAEAEGLYRRVLENNHRHHGALISMAQIAQQKGLGDIAVTGQPCL